ncbi:MAG: hypothetical protein ETSY2_33880 [Candidatus Entotheonella gemina]|uniref:Uncharacterized protein n=1 Tax=Candidatus Entotheonella gemina TaxID=1429439 RepID=W4LZV6_9BACT|nr:MAG: hypothetical protein ETSY2_33880 [Candidatus Entotheonella gemina]
MGDVRLWQGCWLMVLLMTSCQVPAASDRTEPSDATAPPVVASAKTNEQAALKIATLIRDVIQRMHDDGVTSANVATRSAMDYSNPFVRVDAGGRIHTDITVTRVTPEVMADLRASQVHNLQTHAGQTIIQGWVPFDRVVTVAALPFVHHIRPPRYAMRR